MGETVCAGTRTFSAFCSPQKPCGSVAEIRRISDMIERENIAPSHTDTTEDSEADLRELDRVMFRAREEIARKAALREERFRKMLHKTISEAAAEKI